MSRPDYVCCILNTCSDDGLSLCGRTIAFYGIDDSPIPLEFCFLNIDHWFLTRIADDRLVGCPACVAVVRDIADGDIDMEHADPSD